MVKARVPLWTAEEGMFGLRQWYGLALYVARRFRADGALDKASSLSYTSLLSLVPLMAIALAMLAAFPVFDSVRVQLQGALFKNFVPEVGEQVQRYVTTFVGNAGKLTAAGVIGLVFTAVTLLVTIESSLNAIFRVITHRSPLSRLLVYWTAVTLGPLLVGASFSLSAWFFAAQDWAARAGMSGMVKLVTAALPTGLLMFAFSLLYMAVPNRRVRLRDALTGGIAAGLAFALLRFSFGVYVTQAHAYQSIYGAVAAVPIFLFWTYLSWAVILFGAELAAALPEWRLSRPDLGGPLSARRRLSLALTILAVLLEENRIGGQGHSRRVLLDAVGEGERPFRFVMEKLQAEGYVLQTASGRYVLGRDLLRVSLGDVALLLGLGLGQGESADDSLPWISRISSRLDLAAENQHKALDLPLLGVLDEGEPIWTQLHTGWSQGEEENQ